MALYKFRIIKIPITAIRSAYEVTNLGRRRFGYFFGIGSRILLLKLATEIYRIYNSQFDAWKFLSFFRFFA